LVLVVTEPTLSGKHDLERVSELTSGFGIKTLVCINKADVNPQIAEQISKEAQKRGLKVIGKIAYDEAFTSAQMIKASVVEYTSGAITEQIKALWRQLTYALG
jgi:MinD superfamily P-loop ATPase